MKSLTGKFSSARGWTLLLALFLGAGLFVSACGDEEVPTPTTPAPTPPAPTPDPDPPEPTGPATPENLRVSATGSDYLEWAWDAVEGVLGYQGQFSTDSTFTDADPTFLIVAPQTSHRVENLQANMAGHFRVRSGAGTSLTDLQYSDWSGGASGTTSAPPPAVALSAPSGFESSDPDENSIVLTWDEVDDADSYEVEEREDGASSWSDASCGGDDNEVEDPECIAAGLDEGTDYEFRVRGIPAADDTAHTVGEWAETEGTTTGATQVIAPGGMGDLDVTWESTADSITWSWEPMSGATYQWGVSIAMSYDDAANPCAAGITWGDAAATFQHPEPGLSAGDVRLLCVRTGDEDENLSFAWAVTTPESPVVGVGGPSLNDDQDTVTALDWTGIDVKAGFGWELRLVSDPGRNDGDLSGTPGGEVQAACSAGTFVDQGDADLDLSFNYTWDGSISHYSGYLLCVRYANTAGATAWAVPVGATNIDEIYTTPAAPPSPTHEASRATTDGTTRTLEWTVAVRRLTDVPRASGGFEAKTIHYPVRYDHDGVASTDTVSTPQPTSCDDADITAGPSNWSGGTNPNPWNDNTVTTNITTDLDGIAVNSNAIIIPANTGENLNVRLCVRATEHSAGDLTDTSDDLPGPWVIGGNATINKKAP